MRRPWPPPSQPPAGAAMPLAPRHPAGEALVADEPTLARVRPLLSGSARHLVSRFSYGLTPGLAQQVVARGGAQKWFEWQLDPSAVKDRAAAELADWWPGLQYSGPQAWSRHATAPSPAGSHGQLPALVPAAPDPLPAPGTRDHDRVLGAPPARAGATATPVSPTGTLRRQVRSHALGTFDDLLRPRRPPGDADLLDNAVPPPAPNENLARELLELHTVGRGNHTEDDVKNAARILTG